MNKKILFPLFFLFICLRSGYSKPIDAREARTIASLFSNQATSSSGKALSKQDNNLQLAYICTESTVAKVVSAAYYYVFNRGNNSGFIIVSGDDRAKPILGYSDTGSFTIGNIPANFQYWLDFYKMELKELFATEEKTDLPKDKIKDNIITRTNTVQVTPLLKNIRYDQGAPYNNICPLIPGTQERTATGCIATAMAQIMKFHQWPVQGKGSNTYTTRDLKITLSANFGSTTYDWNNALDTYNTDSDYTAAQINTISTLMLHCGISVNMNYNTSSGASVNVLAKALVDNFGYDASLQLHYRNYYTTAQWADMIKEELNSSRPVIYNGQSSSGAHSFVCDGYDANGLFHINWGWGGISDGYFELSTLNPNEQGIGGSLGGYNQGQNILSGIRPASGEQIPAGYLLRLTNGLSANSRQVAQGGTAFITLGYRNLGAGSYCGMHGLGLYRADGTFVKTVYKGAFGRNEDGTIVIDTLSTGQGSDKLQWKIAVNQELPAGNFKIYPVYHPGTSDEDNNWKIITGEIGMPSYLNAVISQSGIEFSDPSDNRPELSVSGLKTIGKLYKDKTGRFEFTLGNSGMEYNGILRIELRDKEDKDVYQTVAQEGIVIGTDETKTITFNGRITFAPGEYFAVVLYDKQNGYLSQVGAPLTVTVSEASAQAPEISILSLGTDLNPDRINGKDEIRFTARLKNTGGFAESKAYAAIYHADGRPGVTIGNQYIYLDKDEEQEVTFRGFAELEDGKYYTRIRMKTGDSDWDAVKPIEINKLSFTLVNEGSDIGGESIARNRVYPNPATDFIYVESDAVINSIGVFSLSGQLLYTEMQGQSNRVTVNTGKLAPGAYLLQIGTENHTENRKFIKK